MGPSVTLLGLFALCLGCCHSLLFFVAVEAFPVQQPVHKNKVLPSRSHARGPLFATENEADGKLYPAMTKEELGVLLDSVPVYAVTEPNKEGIVLLKEKDNTNDIAYFFFSADTANSVYAPLREKTEGASSWDITEYPLGVVWFELFKNPEKGIEYRLVPDGINLGGARKLLEEQSKQFGTPVAEDFQKAYNQIPIFMDQRLRIEAEGGKEIFPMYLSLQDLITTLQQASDEYEAALNVADLETVLEQMQAESENDFRSSAMVPPSPPPKPPSSNTSSMPQSQVEKDDDAPLNTPMAVDIWDD